MPSHRAFPIVLVLPLLLAAAPAPAPAPAPATQPVKSLEELRERYAERKRELEREVRSFTDVSSRRVGDVDRVVVKAAELEDLQKIRRDCERNAREAKAALE